MSIIKTSIALFLLLFLMAKITVAQYLGGDGRGDVSVYNIQSACPGIIYPSIYSGGTENSFSSSGLTQSSCSPLLLPSIFSGGDESLWATSSLAQSNCSPLILPSIFSGGDESVNVSSNLMQTACSNMVYPSIFAGGNDDGYSMNTLQQSSCDALAYPGIYVGGSGSSTSVYQLNVACAPFANFEADTTFVCAGDTVHFSDLSLGSPNSWSWSFPGGNPLSSTTQNPAIVYETPGTYSVSLSISSPNGVGNLTLNNYIVVGAVPNPLIVAGGATTFCEGDSVKLNASSTFPSYLWSNGNTQSEIFVSQTGTYSLLVTAANGCTAVSNSINVVVNSNPIPLITANGPTTLCDSDTLRLTSSPANGYLWLPGSETLQSLNVTSSGTYYVKVSYANGCQRTSDPLSVTFGISPAAPVVTPSGSLAFCNGDSVILTSSPADSYFWSPMGGISQSAVIKNSGTYYITAGNGTGCTSTSLPITVTVYDQTEVPAITASGSTTFCNGDSVILTSSVANSYHWLPGGQSTQSITVNTAGVYSVQTDNGNNCPSLSSATSVVVNGTPATPVLSLSGPSTFCSGDSVVITSSIGDDYLWSPGGETTQSITVKNPGIYYVSVSNASGCSSVSSSVLVSVNTQTSTPLIVANSSTTFCTGDSVVLSAPFADSYLWAPGGQTTQSITVYSSGNYSVQTGTTCPAVSLPVSVVVKNQTPIPSVSAIGNTSFCFGDSVVLTSSPSNTYHWYPNGETTQSITVHQSGTYFVEIDNGSGCSATSSGTLVSVENLPAIPFVSASGSTSFCAGDSIVLTSSPASNYFWYPNGETTQSISVSSAGSWYVQTGSGSCVSVSTPTITNVLNSPSTPQIIVNGDLSLCEGDSVILSAPPTDHYHWYPTGDTTQQIVVYNSGIYYLSVYNDNGCSASSVSGVSVQVNPNPEVDLTSNSVACLNSGEIISLPNLPSQSYFWTVDNAVISGSSTSNSIQIFFNDTGIANIAVVVLNTSSNCFAADSMSIQVLSAPVANAGQDVEVCLGDSVSLLASGGADYQWSPALFLSNDHIPNPVSNPSYTTTYVLQASIGSCIDLDTITVYVNPIPTVEAGSMHQIYSDSCAILDASGGVTYLWTPSLGLSNASIPNPSACPDSSITYFVVATNQYGCTGVDSVRVNVSYRIGGLIFPNTFTPNSDGKNDFWQIDGLESLPNHSLIVYNRWGNKVFDAAPYQNDWEGDCIGKPLPDGTYFFVFDPGNAEPAIRGYVTIIR